MGSFEVYENNKFLYQWDINRCLIVHEDCDEVHFANSETVQAPALPVYEKDGQRLVDIPNEFMQVNGTLKVYAYVCGEDKRYTKKSESFRVLPRPKPADYVYTPTEIKTWESAVAYALRIADESGAFDGVSPTVELQEIEGGTRVIITDAVGEHSFDVMDGNASENSRENFTAVYRETTWEELRSAYDSGKHVYARTGGNIYVLISISDKTATFSRAQQASIDYVTLNSSDKWSSSSVKISDANNIKFADGENLQEKYDNGNLGGNGGAIEALNVVYFNDFSEAISSIKNNSVFNDENKTKSKDSVCMVHEDSVNQRMVVTLLSDVDVNEQQEITFDFEINFNGYTINTVVDTERFHLFNVTSGSVTVNGKNGGGVNATVKNVGKTVMVFSVRNAAPLFVDGGLYTITEENGSGTFVFGCSGDTVIKNTRIEMTCSTKSSENDDSAIFVDGNCNATLENNKINIVNHGKGLARGYTVAKANELICSNNTINADAVDNDAHSGNGTSVGGEIKSGVLAAFLTDEKLHGEFVGLRMNAKKSHICGGVYTSTSHGGIYFEVRDIVSFVENATMGCVEYNGIITDATRKNKAMGAFYIGGNVGENNMTVYMDKCVLYGFCDAINDDTGEYVNDGPVISGRRGQSINHTLYISNTNLAVNPITGTLNDVRVDWGSRLVVGENTNITLDRIDAADTNGNKVDPETVVTFTDRRFSEECVRAYEQIADWSENNPDSPNYVKNRTHWMETFPPIEWDGSTDGKDSFNASALGFGKFYKVSDQVWTQLQAENCETYSINADGTKDTGFPYDKILLDEEEIGFAVLYRKNNVGIVAFFAKQAVDLTSIYGFKIPSAGCYFYQTTPIDWNGGVFGLERQPEPRKLDSKFLPDSVLTDSKLYPLINYSESYDDSIPVEIDGEFTDFKGIIGVNDETDARILDVIKKKQARVIVRFVGDDDEENVFSCNIVLSESKKNGVLFGDCAINHNGKKICITLELGIMSDKLTENVFRIWAESAATIDNILSVLPVYNGEVEE